MNLNNQELSKFNYFIKKLDDDSLNISSQDNKLILGKNTGSSPDLLQEKVKGVVNYICSHSVELNSKQKTRIESIQTKLSSAIKEQDQEIQKTLQPYLNQLDTWLHSPEIPLKECAVASSSIVFQIAAIPKDKQQFMENLQLVLDHFPRYQLHQDLSVFDSTFQNMPIDWNFDLLMKALDSEFKKHAMQKPEEVSLQAAILHLLKSPKPIKMGMLIETPNTSSAILLICFVHMVAKGFPCIVNREFFKTRAQDFSLYPSLNLSTDVDIYLQKQGDLCVVIPKGKSLLEFGFNPGNLEISTGAHLIPTSQPLQIATGIEQILINETEKERFFRLIEFDGHGLSDHFTNSGIAQPASIAGLSKEEFQQVFAALNDKNLAFMSLGSCFSGGTNSLSIHLPDQTVPCPIYIQSSFDTIIGKTPRIDSHDTTCILDYVEKTIFPVRKNQDPYITEPRQLTKAHEEDLSLLWDVSNPALSFMNLGTLLLPSNKADIPKVAYTLANSEQILDVSRLYRGQTQTGGVYIEDTNLDRKAYIFSDPIVPITLEVSSNLPVILLSRGGSTHHVIKEIIAPQQNIEDIARETFNAFNFLSRKNFPETANKVFFIGHFKCRFLGAEVDLFHVVIKSTLTEREIFFQLENENQIRSISFSLEENALYPWKINKSSILPYFDGIRAFYLAQAISTPSTKALLQATGGKKSEVDFIEALDEFFFTDQDKGVTVLLSAILKDHYQNSKNAPETVKALNAIEQSTSSSPQAYYMRQACLINSSNIADSMGLTYVRKQLEPYSYTSLMAAVKNGNLTQVQQIINAHSMNKQFYLECKTTMQSTALHIAIEQKQFEIAKCLINEGANLYLENHLSDTALSLACSAGDPEFVKWILNISQGLEGDFGGKALYKTLEAKNYTMAKLLISYGVGIKANLDYIPLLNQCIRDQNNEILKLLLEKGVDPNQQDPLYWVAYNGSKKGVEMALTLLEAGADINRVSKQGQTPLHSAIVNKNYPVIEFLIKRGASLQIEDNNKCTPLELASQTPGLLEFILQIPGIDINPKNTKLNSFFQQAIFSGNIKLAKLLITNGIDINQSFEKSEPLLMFYLLNIPPGINPQPVIQFFIDNGVDLTQQDSHGNSVMHLVTHKQNLAVFKYLREVKVPYDKPLNHNGISPYIEGLLTSNPQIIFLRELLDHDKHLLGKDFRTISATLKNSIKRWSLRHPTAVLTLMEKIDDLPIYSNMIAASKEKWSNNLTQKEIEVAKINEELKKIKQSPDGKLADFYGLPILHAAFYLGFEADDTTRNVIFTLIDQFPECIHEKYIKLPTELTNDLEILKALVKKGAEVSLEPRFGISDLELLKLLDQKGIDLSGETGLHFLSLFTAKTYNRADQKEGIAFLLSKIQKSIHRVLSKAILEEVSDDIINLLIKHPLLDLQIADSGWNSPLANAVMTKNASLSKQLVSMGAKYSVSTSISFQNYSNPFFVLCMHKDSKAISEIAECLLQSDLVKEINKLVNFSTQSIPPLTFAINMQKEKLISLFIKYGANVNIPDMDGNTPLHNALISFKDDLNKHLPMIRLLLDSGAQWSIPNNEGLTAEDLAIKLRSNEILELMHKTT